MSLIEDDTLINPTIPFPQHQYILNLQDKPSQYTRFFDALLIPSQSHPQFFTDLRSFRSQPQIISLLSTIDTTTTSSSSSSSTQVQTQTQTQTKETNKQTYRLITETFLSSRFAHPWCRKAGVGAGAGSSTRPGNSQNTGGRAGRGWWGAEWKATGRKPSQDIQNQEDKLHKTLLPIWVIMRAKMFPGDEVVVAWYDDFVKLEEEERRKEKKEKKEMETNVTSIRLEQEQEQEKQSTTSNPRTTQPIMNKKKKNNNRRNPERYVSEDTDDDNDNDDDDDDDNNDDGNEISPNQQISQVATGVLRLAAAGMIVSTMPKRKLWKLSRGK